MKTHQPQHDYATGVRVEVVKMMAPRNSTPIIEREVVSIYQVKLERVLGVTVSNNAALDSDTNSETVAYPAGIRYE
ncbi:hypothetical protein PPYR_11575 [Photinus pyralis]|uniref:Uncharacterized protein n=1 Tax=Photinus pyralis TaxID=7054 RepID=A0A5N4ABN5_PHOPY|nr:hypothetical protein PPYR_11575 [Photinus pyralis]